MQRQEQEHQFSSLYGMNTQFLVHIKMVICALSKVYAGKQRGMHAWVQNVSMPQDNHTK